MGVTTLWPILTRCDQLVWPLPKFSHIAFFQRGITTRCVHYLFPPCVTIIDHLVTNLQGVWPLWPLSGTTPKFWSRLVLTTCDNPCDSFEPLPARWTGVTTVWPLCDHLWPLWPLGVTTHTKFAPTCAGSEWPLLLYNVYCEAVHYTASARHFFFLKGRELWPWS